jgi:hypothetical protein
VDLQPATLDTEGEGGATARPQADAGGSGRLQRDGARCAMNGPRGLGFGKRRESGERSGVEWSGGRGKAACLLAIDASPFGCLSPLSLMEGGNRQGKHLFIFIFFFPRTPVPLLPRRLPRRLVARGPAVSVRVT